MPESKAASFLQDFAKVETSNDNEYKAFSFGRVGSRSQPMITFVKSDGYAEAISYVNLNRIWSSDTKTELKLDFGVREVEIRGNNLEDLFRYVATNRCSEITESSICETMGSQMENAIVTFIELKIGSQKSEA